MAVKERKIARAAMPAELPEGWRRVKFGDVVRNVDVAERNPLENGLERYVGLDHLDPESLHIKRWGLIEEGTSFTRKFVKGQVLFGKRRAYQRKAAVADFDGICSSDILVFEPISNNLIPELLPFIVQSDSFYEKALSTSAGSLSPRTKWKDLAAYEFTLPLKDEQRRIADILWAADKHFRCAKDVVQKTSTFREVLFEHLLRPQPATKKSSGTRWSEVRFEELMKRSPESGYSAISAGEETGHYVLTLPALSRTGYQRGYLKPVNLTRDVEGTKLRKGDFLISRSNTIELVGLAGVFDEERDDVSFPDTMMRIVIDEERIDKRFLLQFLLSDNGRKQIQRVAAGTSASMKKINRGGLSSLLIPLPSLDMQHVILTQLDSSSRAVSSAKEQVSSCRSLKIALIETLLV